MTSRSEAVGYDFYAVQIVFRTQSFQRAGFERASGKLPSGTHAKPARWKPCAREMNQGWLALGFVRLSQMDAVAAACVFAGVAGVFLSDGVTDAGTTGAASTGAGGVAIGAA